MTQPERLTAGMTSWSTLIGHRKIEKWFQAAIQQGRLAGSFLLVGSPGIGKRTVANLLARTLLCETSDPKAMDPCGTCEACVQVEARTHPDVARVSKPADKASIPLELLIGPDDARMQEGFCRDLRLKPMSGTRKVAILEDADLDTLRLVADRFRQQVPQRGVAVLATVIDGSPRLVAAVTKDLIKEGIKAGDLIKVAAKEIGGGGGGRPSLAEAGGKDPEMGGSGTSDESGGSGHKPAF